MTRSKHQSPASRIQAKDRHLPRNRFMDPRGLPKKEGAGQHNWGKTTDELAELDEHYEYNEEMPKYNKEKIQNTKAAETNRDIGKIQIVKPEEFETLNRVTSSE